MTRTLKDLPGWLEAELLEGLSGLLLLRLEGAPAADASDATANVWLAAVRSRNRVWVKERDVLRMRQGFAQLYASCDRWPTPKQLLDALPAEAEQQRLPPPPLTDEDKQRGNRMLARLREGLSGPRQPTPRIRSRADLDRYLDEQVALANAQTNVRK